MMTIEQGTRLRDNDPRSNGKVVTVTQVVEAGGVKYAMYHTGVRFVRIRFDRIYTDGKDRHQGWSVVPPVEH